MENTKKGRETTQKTKQESNLLSTNPKEDNEITAKGAGTNNHYSLISLNFNGLNSQTKRHRLAD